MILNIKALCDTIKDIKSVLNCIPQFNFEGWKEIIEKNDQAILFLYCRSATLHQENCVQFSNTLESCEAIDFTENWLLKINNQLKKELIDLQYTIETYTDIDDEPLFVKIKPQWIKY